MAKHRGRVVIHIEYDINLEHYPDDVTTPEEAVAYDKANDAEGVFLENGDYTVVSYEVIKPVEEVEYGGDD